MKKSATIKNSVVLVSFTLLIFFGANKIIDNGIKEKKGEQFNQQNNPKLLSACINKVFVFSRASVWTILTDGEGYAISTLKLLNSIQKNVNESVDANILELKNKPIKTRIKRKLIKRGWRICQVERIPARNESLMPKHFRDQFVKFHLWRMVEYESVVYIDSDCAVVGNIDYLFRVYKELKDNHKAIAVARDMRNDRWADTFNMGVFVIVPNLAEYELLIKSKNDPTFKYELIMSEQGFLNSFYNNSWFEFEFEYNAMTAIYQSFPRFWQQREKNIRIIHFTVAKPWECTIIFEHLCQKWREI